MMPLIMTSQLYFITNQQYYPRTNAPVNPLFYNNYIAVSHQPNTPFTISRKYAFEGASVFRMKRGKDLFPPIHYRFFITSTNLSNVYAPCSPSSLSLKTIKYLYSLPACDCHSRPSFNFVLLSSPSR